MKIKDYRIVAEGTVSDLEARVRELIAQGWQPLGGAFKLGTDWGVAQAMVK